MATLINKRKIFNDPVYGFITIPDDLVFDLIEHPFFQRLRRIKQLGLTHLVYPGALHTRFHHALGAFYLGRLAVETLRLKGHEITTEEEQGVSIALLLHDIGHGPFSHALEHSIVSGMTHEDLSLLFINKLNEEFDGKLSVAARIFTNTYPKRFLNQLVSGQLDMDRMDYLKRDSFYTGVSEGVISSDRILNMLNIVGDDLVVEAKGIYSVEKFIVARRLMYWQVYLHKTVLAAEQMLVFLLRRAKELVMQGVLIFTTPDLLAFLQHEYSLSDFEENREILERFARLDDYDIYTCMKIWMNAEDKVLSYLSKAIVNRHLFKVEIQTRPFSPVYIREIENEVAERDIVLNINEIPYVVYHGEITNNAYNPRKDKISILNKDGSVSDVTEASAQLNISILSETITNYYLCYPKK
ncbi:MAG: HD domain-containing protein [Bacteroidota bacterium]